MGGGMCMDITMQRRAVESHSRYVAEDELATAARLWTRLEPGMPHEIGIAEGALPMPRWQ